MMSCQNSKMIRNACLMLILILCTFSDAYTQESSLILGYGRASAASQTDGADVGDFQVGFVGDPDPLAKTYVSVLYNITLSRPHWLSFQVGLAYEAQESYASYLNEGDIDSPIPTGVFGTGYLIRLNKYNSLVFPLDVEVSVLRYLRGYAGVHYWMANRKKLPTLGIGYEIVDVVEASLLNGAIGYSVGFGIQYKRFNLRYMYRERPFLKSFDWEGITYPQNGIGFSQGLEFRYFMPLNRKE